MRKRVTAALREYAAVHARASVSGGRRQPQDRDGAASLDRSVEAASVVEDFGFGPPRGAGIGIEGDRRTPYDQLTFGTAGAVSFGRDRAHP